MLRNITLSILHILQVLNFISPKLSHEITTKWNVCYFFRIVLHPFHDWNSILKPCLIFHLSFLILHNCWYWIVYNVIAWKSNFEGEKISSSDKKQCKKKNIFLLLFIAYFNLSKLLLLILCTLKIKQKYIIY